MKALIKFFDEINIPITQARFSGIDKTNVNSGSRGGLKRYILHKILMALWVGCGYHKLALCLKHFLKEFACVAEFDIALLSLFHSCSNLRRPTRKIKHCQFAKAPQGGLLIWVTRHRLVQLLCVTTRERSPKHCVYS